MSLIDLVKDQLSGETLGKLSSLLGVSEAETGKAAAAAVPSLLAALSGLASRPGGAEKVVSALRAPEVPSSPGDFGNILRGPGAGEVEKKGGDLLGSLLGSGGLAALVGALAKFVGTHPEVVRKLLSVVGPMILSVLAGQLKQRGQFSASGLAGLLAENKSQIEAALPAGLHLPDVTRLVDSGRATVEAAAGGLPKWLLPLAAIVLLGGLGWYYLQGSKEPAGGKVDEAVPQPAPVEKAPAPTPTPAPAPAPAPVEKKADTVLDEAAIAKILDQIKSAPQYLTDVKDVPTAEAALPKIQGLNVSLDTLKAGWAKLPEATRTSITTAVKATLPKLKDLITKVLALPGVSEKLKPVLDALVTKLTGLS